MYVVCFVTISWSVYKTDVENIDKFYTLAGFYCDFSHISLAAMSSRILGTYCGILPQFYLFSQSNKVEISFSSDKRHQLMFISVLFQIITKSILQSNNTFHRILAVDENQVVRTSIFEGTIIIFGPHIFSYQWSFFSQPGSVLKMDTLLLCGNSNFLELLVFYGFGAYGQFSQKDTCPCDSLSISEEASACSLSKSYPTFVMTLILIAHQKIKTNKLLMKTTFVSQKGSNAPSKAILFRYQNIRRGQNDFVIDLKTNKYQVHQMQTENGEFIQFSAESKEFFKYKIHFCGIAGLYILETSINSIHFYGPYCNLTNSDFLNKDSFPFYSHSEWLQVVTYNFRPELEPLTLIVIKSIRSKCQGVANVCFAFSKRTPERWSILQCLRPVYVATLQYTAPATLSVFPQIFCLSPVMS